MIALFPRVNFRPAGEDIPKPNWRWSAIFCAEANGNVIEAYELSVRRRLGIAPAAWAYVWMNDGNAVANEQGTANPNVDVDIDVSGNTVGDTADDNDTNTATATGESADVAVQDNCR